MLCIAVFFLGIGFNYLGRDDMVHIIYNPVVLLILWNIGVFAIFLIRHSFLNKARGRVLPSPDHDPLHETEPPDAEIRFQALEPGYTSSLYGRVLRNIWFSFYKYISKKKQQIKKASSSLKITHRYMELWWASSMPLPVSRTSK